MSTKLRSEFPGTYVTHVQVGNVYPVIEDPEGPISLKGRSQVLSRSHIAIVCLDWPVLSLLFDFNWIHAFCLLHSFIHLFLSYSAEELSLCHCVQVPRYDTHVAYVSKQQGSPFHVPCPPDHLGKEWNAPQTSDLAPVYSELVLFESAAILPRFILSLDVPD
jgi:hypothetical protein